MTIKPATGLSARLPSLDLSTYGQELDEMERFGVDSVEVATFEMDLVVGGKIRTERLAQLKSACAGRKFIYSVHGPLSLNLADEAWRLPRHMEILERSLEIASEIGAVNYVLHGGIIRQQLAEGVNEALKRQSECLAKAGDIAAKLGVNICVETMFSGYQGVNVTSSPARLARDLAELNHPNVGATLDVSHAYLKLTYDGLRDSFMDEMKAISPWAKHVHVHDSFGRQDDIWMYADSERVAYGHGDLHLPVGWGDIPWDRIIDECDFPSGAIFNLEMKPRFWYAVQDSVHIVKGYAARARILEG